MIGAAGRARALAVRRFPQNDFNYLPDDNCCSR